MYRYLIAVVILCSWYSCLDIDMAAEPFQCYECEGDNCTDKFEDKQDKNVRNCTALEQQCIKFVKWPNDDKNRTYTRNCTNLCTEITDQTMTVNKEDFKATIRCCNANKCNSATMPKLSIAMIAFVAFLLLLLGNK